MKTKACGELINLASPTRRERVQGFQPPWYTVFIYRCSHGHETRVKANDVRGKQTVPGVGGIYCPQRKVISE